MNLKKQINYSALLFVLILDALCLPGLAFAEEPAEDKTAASTDMQNSEIEKAQLNEVNGEMPLLMVLPLAANGVDEEVAAALTDMLSSELEKAQLYEVISRDDLATMLSQIELKQLMGVESEEELAAVAGRTHANYLLRGSVGLVGATYLVSLSLLDVSQAKVVRRVQQNVAGDPDDLVGSLHAAVVALALEEEGVPPRITADLVESMNIARKNKTFFLRFMAGYELPVGPVVDDATLAYMLPGMMALKVNAAYHVLPWLQLVFETGASLSIAEQFAMQNKLSYNRARFDSANGTPRFPQDDDPSSASLIQEVEVSTTEFDYSSIRIPFNFMVRFQPKSGRLLPYFQTGLGFSWQRYSMGDEHMEKLFTDPYVMEKVGTATCPAEYTRTTEGRCLRELNMKPLDPSISYYNLQFPVAAGIDYLITHHFGMGVEARYLLTYSLNKNDMDLNALFTSDLETPFDYSEGADDIREVVGDAVPIRRLHHGISVMLSGFYYF